MARPVGDFKDSDFTIVNEKVPEPNEGEAVVKNILVSIDPTHRIWASDIPQYMPRVGLGTVMRAGTIGQVVKTACEEKMPVGSLVSAQGGVQDFCCLPFAALNPVVPGVPLSYNHSIFSVVIGLTAWVGTNICEPKAGETMVISGAAGAVGSVAAQIGKNRGARVIGIAGSAEKVRWLVEDCGLDGAVNYKDGPIAESIGALCPDGVDSYFDNVGGETLEVLLEHMNNFGRIAYCGSISQYNDTSSSGLRNFERVLMNRLKVQGFICVDHLTELEAAMGELVSYLRGGKLVIREHIDESGIERYPEVVRMLYSGKNEGKLMMKINSPRSTK